jgi:hypothetical protein
MGWRVSLDGYEFFDEMYSVGMIPVSLLRWQMTGLEDKIRMIGKK